MRGICHHDLAAELSENQGTNLRYIRPGWRLRSQFLLHKGYEIWDSSRDVQISIFANLAVMGTKEQFHFESRKAYGLHAYRKFVFRRINNETLWR
jgi:hypothetical protein